VVHVRAPEDVGPYFPCHPDVLSPVETIFLRSSFNCLVRPLLLEFEYFERAIEFYDHENDRYYPFILLRCFC